MVLGALSMLLLCPRAFALDPSLDLTQYAHTAWTYGNGLLNGRVNAFAQTPDGYLWLGTSSGLVRFDGVRAVPLALPSGQQLPSNAVGTLLAARDGTLWIGTRDGLVSWKNGKLTEYPALALSTVATLLQDRGGTVWAGTFMGPTGKLCAIRSETTTCYGDDGSLGAGVVSLYEDSDGSLWVGATNGLWRWNPGPPIRYLATPIQGRQTLAQGDHGPGLIVAADSVRQIAGTRVMNYSLDGVPSPLTATRLLRDRKGGLWIGTNAHGLVHSYQGKTSLFTHNDGLSSDQVSALFEDREGTIWVATSDGLDRFRELPVTSLSVKKGLSSGIATSVLAARDGSIWIGTADGLNRWNHGRTTIYRRRSNPGLPNDAIQSLFEDERGRIWVSGSRGLAAFENGRFTAEPSVPAGLTHAISSDNHGGLWLSLWVTANDYGLAHLVDGRIVEQMSWQSVGGGPGSGLVPDPDGGIWTGLISGGIAHFRGGQIQKLRLSNHAPRAPRVRNLSRDRDGAIWAATDDGLSRITNGRVATLTTANGLPCDAVHWIIEDDLSSYWLYTQCGLVRIARTELDAWTSDPKRMIHPTTFDSADGIRLPHLMRFRAFRPQVTKSSDGKIWFVNGDTASFIDPSHIGINTLPPPVHIEQITANGKTYDVARGLRLPPLVRDLQIDYTALSFVAPEKVRFRYKLEGYDDDWHEAGNRRQAFYTNLPPRNYRFRVMACNNSGVWSESDAVMDLVIPPAFYQTLWFRALGVLSLAGLIWGLYFVRLRRIAAIYKGRVEARLQERERIARDLHDTLLQSVQGLILKFDAVIKQIPREEPARQAMENALDRADQVLAEGKDRVRYLRDTTVSLSDLPAAFQRVAEETPQGRATTFKTIVEGNVRELHPIVLEESYSIGREALINALAHSECLHIEVEIIYGPRQFRLRVRDDGRGIDSRILEEGGRTDHWGLKGMRERAQKIGAQLELWSHSETGTEVELIVPAATAYRTLRAKSKSSLFRRSSGIDW
jgi:ligand-binding sensor domain-containing protein/signal transduction histidine kinase